MKIKWIQANTNRQLVPGICPRRNTDGVFQAEGESGPRVRYSGKMGEQEVVRMWEDGLKTVCRGTCDVCGAG